MCKLAELEWTQCIYGCWEHPKGDAYLQLPHGITVEQFQKFICLFLRLSISRIIDDRFVFSLSTTISSSYLHIVPHRDHNRSQFSSMITDHADFFLEKRWTDLKISLKDPRDLIERILRNKSTQIRKVQLIFFFSKLGNQKDPRLEISRLTFVGKFSNFPLNISLSFFPPRLTIRLHVRIYSSQFGN